MTEDDHDWIQNGRTHKLRSRKGRSIVHKNLEDNYGAVIVANHEALAQVLENVCFNLGKKLGYFHCYYYQTYRFSKLYTYNRRFED